MYYAMASELPISRSGRSGQGGRNKLRRTIIGTVTQSIGVPSAKGMKDAFTDFAIGAGGGLVFAITRAIFGSGLIGALAAPVLAGSIVKGVRGTALSTIAGFMLTAGGLGGGQAQASSQDSSGSRGVM